MGSVSPPPGQRVPARPAAVTASVEERPARGGCLTIMLGLNILGGVILAWLWLAAPDIFKMVDRTSPNFTFTVLLGVLQAFFALALWRWQKWGFWGLLVTTIFTTLVNVQEGGQTSLIGGLVGPALIWWFLQPHWANMPYRTSGSRTRAAIFWVPALAVVLAFLVMGALRLRKATSIAFDPTRNAVLDIQTGLEKGSSERKRVLLLLGGDWSPESRSFAAALKDDEVENVLKSRFEVVKVFIDPSMQPPETLKRFPAFGSVPHLYVLSRSGDCAASVPGSQLGTDRARILEFLAKWGL